MAKSAKVRIGELDVVIAGGTDGMGAATVRLWCCCTALARRGRILWGLRPYLRAPRDTALCISGGTYRAVVDSRDGLWHDGLARGGFIDIERIQMDLMARRSIEWPPKFQPDSRRARQNLSAWIAGKRAGCWKRRCSFCRADAIGGMLRASCWRAFSVVGNNHCRRGPIAAARCPWAAHLAKPRASGPGFLPWNSTRKAPAQSSILSSVAVTRIPIWSPTRRRRSCSGCFCRKNKSHDVLLSGWEKTGSVARRLRSSSLRWRSRSLIRLPSSIRQTWYTVPAKRAKSAGPCATVAVCDRQRKSRSLAA